MEGAATAEGTPDSGRFFGVPVATGMPPPAESNWHEDVFDNEGRDAWFDIMDADHLHPVGTANFVMPSAQHGENVVLCHSGWGDGHYPFAVARSADGALLGVHIDLLVVGSPDDDTGPPEPAVPASGDSAAGKKGLFKRLFGG